MRKLEVCLSPDLLHLYEVKGKIAIVIDVLRATSTMCTVLEHGAEAIIPVSEIDECLKYLGKPNHLLAAERGGEKVEGFDFGNSPLQYKNVDLTGKTLVMTTTNGTLALNKCLDAEVLVVASFLNLSSIVKLLASNTLDVLILASGWRGVVNMEDSLLAGAIVQIIRAEFDEIDDSGKMMARLYEEIKDKLPGIMQEFSHYRRLEGMGVVEDINYCFKTDDCPVIPIYKNGRLVKM